MPQQFSLPGFDIDARARDRLLFAVRPDVEAARRVVRLRVGGEPVLGELLHVTLHHLGDYHGLPPDLVAKALEAGAAVAMAPFYVAFDQLMDFGRGRSMLVLTGIAEVDGLVALQRTVGIAMAEAGLRRWVKSSFTPHMTIAYDGPSPDQAVEPIGWTVREFVLIHSLIGQTKHIVLGRWAFRA